jgi:protocatechuate 3,4-dioxygenase beta subunit
LLLASDAAVKQYGLQPKARIVAAAVAGVAPRIMGFGPAPAMRKVLALSGLKLADVDVIELNEAFASQALAVLRDHGIADDAAHVNPNGGAIALGHPLGASGARLVTTALYQLRRTGGKYALCTMCIGVGQGIAMIIERDWPGADGWSIRRPPIRRMTADRSGATARGATDMSDVVGYRRPYFNTQPSYLYPGYRSTIKRAPTRPLVLLPHTLSETTGPVFGAADVAPGDHDLTAGHPGQPLGERIVVSGRLPDENVRPVAHALIEMWQANAAGRYAHAIDDHDRHSIPISSAAAGLPMPKEIIDSLTIKPGAYPGAIVQRGGWRICISRCSAWACAALVTQMYFPGDPLLP